MRLLIPILLGLLAIGLVGIAVVLLRRRGGSVDVRDRGERVVLARGANRCVEAARLLRELSDRQPEALPEAWDRIELPLLEALPDCPPDYKVDLINALDAAAKAVAKREIAQRIVTMRNALIK